MWHLWMQRACAKEKEEGQGEEEAEEEGEEEVGGLERLKCL